MLDGQEYVDGQSTAKEARLRQQRVREGFHKCSDHAEDIKELRGHTGHSAAQEPRSHGI